MDSTEESTDAAKVVQALANGIRSEREIAATVRLPLDRVQFALSSLISLGCVIEVTSRRSRLTDNGKDMLKEANAARRKR
jgi:predicted methyltransferase